MRGCIHCHASYPADHASLPYQQLSAGCGRCFSAFPPCRPCLPCAPSSPVAATMRLTSLSAWRRSEYGTFIQHLPKQVGERFADSLFYHMIGKRGIADGEYGRILFYRKSTIIKRQDEIATAQWALLKINRCHRTARLNEQGDATVGVNQASVALP